MFSYQGVLTLIRLKQRTVGTIPSGQKNKQPDCQQTVSTFRLKVGPFFFQYLQDVFRHTFVYHNLHMLLLSLLRVCLSPVDLYIFLNTLCIHLLGFSCCQLEDLCQAMCSYMCLQYKCWFLMYCICPNQERGKYWNNYTKLKRTVSKWFLRFHI